MEEKVLQLKRGITITNFDDGNLTNSYVISYQNRYWKVSEFVYYIFKGLEKKQTIMDLRYYLMQEYSFQIDGLKLSQVIDQVFATNGLLEGTEALTPTKKNKMLWAKVTLIPSKIVQKFNFLSIFFNTRCVEILGSIVILWITFILLTESNALIAERLLSLQLREVILCYLYIILAGFVHELGHSAATIKYGGKSGEIGVGIYFLMPVLFSNVTDAWRLKRKQRVMVDLGGIYLQGAFLFISFVVNIFIFHSSLWNIAILISSFQILSNLNPFIKLDGYWILVDFLGESDILLIIRQTWMNLLQKLMGKTIKYPSLGRLKSSIIYLYTVFVCVFYIYFIKFLWDSLTMSFSNFSEDIQWLFAINSAEISLSIHSIVQYLSGRLTSFIVMFLLLRMIWKGIKKLIFVYKKRFSI